MSTAIALNQWIQDNRELEVRNPYNNEVIDTVRKDTAKSVQAAIGRDDATEDYRLLAVLDGAAYSSPRWYIGASAQRRSSWSLLKS